jgi:hypothetical protein
MLTGAVPEKKKKIEGKDFQDRTRKLNKKFSGTQKQKIMQLVSKL